MFDWLSAPVDMTMSALGFIKDLIVWGLFIYGAFAMASVAGIIAKGYYTIRVMKEAAVLIKDLTVEVRALRESRGA